MWMEYLAAAFPRINGEAARRIVLYLAKNEPEERTRRQIRDDLKLDTPDDELEKKLHQLVKADILADGGTNFRFRGLGDRVFAMVFRRVYGEELDDLTVQEIEEEFKRELATVRREAARHRGSAAEYKVRYRLLAASLAGATLADVVTGGALSSAPISPEGALAGNSLGPFVTLRKARLYLDQESSYEIDVHAVSAPADGTDLMVEVKDRERVVTEDAVRRLVEARSKLSGQLERETIFLFYSESGLTEKTTAKETRSRALPRSPAAAVPAARRQVDCERVWLTEHDALRYTLSMIKGFADRETETVWRGQISKKLPQDIQRVARRKSRMLNNAMSLEDLRVPPGNRLEAMRRERAGQHSIRINDQWRICFLWKESDACDVEIVDYH